VTLLLRYLCLFVSLTLPLFSQPGYSNGTLIDLNAIDGATPQLELSGRLEYIKAKRLPERVTPSDVDANVSQWRPVPSGQDNLGLRAGAYWFRATVINRSNVAREFQLVNDFPSVNDLSLYHIDSHGNVTTLIKNAGLEFPYLPRINSHHKPVVSLFLTPNETVTLLWHVESDPLFRFRPVIWDKQVFNQQDYLHTLMYGLFYGVLIALFIYNIYLWKSAQNKTCLYYSAYLLTTLYMLAASEGDLYQFLMPSLVWPKIPVYIIAYVINIGSFCLFISTFLTLRYILPKHNLLLQITAGTSALLLLIGNFFHQENAFVSAIWFCSIVYLVAAFTVLYAEKQQLLDSRILILASSIALLTALINCLAVTSSIPGNIISIENINAAGIVLTQLLFSLAVAEKLVRNNNSFT
jgi:hypothetical protein